MKETLKKVSSDRVFAAAASFYSPVLNHFALNVLDREICETCLSSNKIFAEIYLNFHIKKVTYNENYYFASNIWDVYRVG